MAGRDRALLLVADPGGPTPRIRDPREIHPSRRGVICLMKCGVCFPASRKASWRRMFKSLIVQPVRLFTRLGHDWSGRQHARDSALASPVGRTLTKGLSEEPGQMCLIRKSYAQGYFPQRCPTGHHQVTGSLQALSYHVGVWRLANSQFEFPREVRRASTRNRTKIPDENGAMQIAVNVSSHAKHLPSRQTAPCGAVSARTTLDLRLQDV
jgi:hypothetical protein